MGSLISWKRRRNLTFWSYEFLLPKRMSLVTLGTAGRNTHSMGQFIHSRVASSSEKPFIIIVVVKILLFFCFLFFFEFDAMIKTGYFLRWYGVFIVIGWQWNSRIPFIETERNIQIHVISLAIERIFIAIKFDDLAGCNPDHQSMRLQNGQWNPAVFRRHIERYHLCVNVSSLTKRRTFYVFSYKFWMQLFWHIILTPFTKSQKKIKKKRKKTKTCSPQ